MLYTFPKFDNSLLVNLTYLFYITLQFISMRNSTHKKSPFGDWFILYLVWYQPRYSIILWRMWVLSPTRPSAVLQLLQSTPRILFVEWQWSIHFLDSSASHIWQFVLDIKLLYCSSVSLNLRRAYSWGL